MRRGLFQSMAFLFCAVLTYGISTPTLRGADEKEKTTSPEKKTPEKEKGPDWSKFVQVSDVIGEVTKTDKDGFTLRITWYTLQQQGGGQPQRPQLGRPGQLPQMRRPGVQRPPQVKEHHEDHNLTWADEGVARLVKLPPKTDEKGKPMAYTAKELEEARKPTGYKGYAADRADVKVGEIVEVVLVRPKDIAPAKATEADLRVKMVVILGETNKTAPAPTPKKN
jgi:hypothetical protein